jgi:hypothetical protein
MAVLPLAVLSVALAGSPWLRVFPAATMVIPLFGAAILSVGVAVVVNRLFRFPLYVTTVVDVLAFTLYSLLIVLRDPVGITHLYDGLTHGPAQILTFALPLVSPSTLLIPPVALCWLAGAIVGESIGRDSGSLVPHAGLLVFFGVSYAATQRAVIADTSQARWIAVLLAGGLLLCMTLLRTVQAWIRRNVGADATEGEGVIPLRPVAAGAVVVTLASIVAVVSAQSSVVSGQPAAPVRVPSVLQSHPVTPLAFISSLRPAQGSATDTKLFNVVVDRPIAGYLAVANVDFYDGDSWSFTRTFRPTGGVVPAELDADLQPKAAKVTQNYRVTSDQLVSSPWMPYIARPASVDNVAINVDSVSGMIVPAAALTADATYSVTSLAQPQTLAQLPATTLAAGGTAPIDTQLPVSIKTTLAKVVTSFVSETGTSSGESTHFLQDLAKDLRTNYGLAGGPVTQTPSGASAAPGAARSSRTGSTNFSDVVASIIGSQRSGTPEQYATLVALIARQIGVPARVVTGFRVRGENGQPLPAGSYDVTASQATSWVEVPMHDAGWVVLDPTPTSFAAKDTNDSVGAASPSPKATAVPSRNELQAGNNAGHAVAKKSAVPQTKSASRLPYLLWGAATLLLLIFVGVLLLILRKRRRRRKRRALEDPRESLIAAWAQGLDSLVEAGLPNPRPQTGVEVASSAAELFGPNAGHLVTTLARSADVALYSSGSVITRELADEAWFAERNMERLVVRELKFLPRLRARLRYADATKSTGWDPGPDSWSSKD